MFIIFVYNSIVMAKTVDHIKVISQNKKAHFNYFLSDFLECGISLSGTEIKSIKLGNANINDAYVLIRNQEAYIINMHIAAYEKGNIFNKDPLRDRKLLLHKHEIIKLDSKSTIQGYTIIPTRIYLKDGRCKIEIALGKGKKLYDKRENIKKRDIKEEIDRTIKNNRY